MYLLTTREDRQQPFESWMWKIKH